MRDGIKLAIDYYLDNASTEKYPAILELTPYGRGEDGLNYRIEGEYWYKNGYVLIMADCRGTGDSEGNFEFFAREGEDGFDLIEWISKQTWSNGKIGMRGASYSGTNQLFTAVKQPSGLKCITPNAVYGRPFFNPPNTGGAFQLFWILGFNTLIRTKYQIKNFTRNTSTWLSHRPLNTIDSYSVDREIPLFRTILEHSTIDTYWKKLLISESEYSKINIPSLAFSGTFDFGLSGTIYHYENSKNFNPSKKDRFIFIGPYEHVTTSDGGYDYLTGKPVKNFGDLVIEDNGFLPALDMHKQFYDWCLKNMSRPNWKKENVYVIGSNKWLNGDNLLVNKSKESYLYLSSSGKLSFDIPKVEEKNIFSFDPNKPFRSDDSRTNLLSPVDFRNYLNRSDFLIYTSEVLKNPLSFFGNAELELTISASTKDTDFIAFLMDVYEDGRSIRIGSNSNPVLRTRYREGYDKEVLMEENTKYNIKIRLDHIIHTFVPGHKIRLAITSSFYPFVSINPNTGNSIQTDTDEPIISNQTIYIGNPSNNILSRIKFMALIPNNSNTIFNQNKILFLFFYLFSIYIK